MSIYALKPRFQTLLRPLTSALAANGVSANQVTLVAAIVSLAVGVFVALQAPARLPFVLIPLWMAVRMALNAIDGMLAREYGQKSKLGAYLNELGDVVSDSALYLPFGWLPPFGASWFGALGLWAALGLPLPDWLSWLMPAVAIALVVTIVNRVRGGLSESGKAPSRE